MRIGFDVDGVLADFATAYQQLTVESSGRDLFHRGDNKNPPCWDWPEYRGYTAGEMKEVWKLIKQDPRWNLDLDELSGCGTLRLVILDIIRRHDVYFITDRPSVRAKWQTEQWLRSHLNIELPTVIISNQKGMIAKALKLDAYIDDAAHNVNAVVSATLPEGISVTPPKMLEPATRTYLLSRSYNQEPGLPERPVHVDIRVRRVNSLGEMLDAELQNL